MSIWQEQAVYGLHNSGIFTFLGMTTRWGRDNLGKLGAIFVKIYYQIDWLHPPADWLHPQQTGFIRRADEASPPVDEASPLADNASLFIYFFNFFYFLKCVLFVCSRSFTIRTSVENWFFCEPMLMSKRLWRGSERGNEYDTWEALKRLGKIQWRGLVRGQAKVMLKLGERAWRGWLTSENVFKKYLKCKLQNILQGRWAC